MKMSKNMTAFDLIAKRLNGNRGLAEEAIQLIEKYADFNEIEKEFAFDGDEIYWKEVCDGEMSDISDRLTDADWYIYHGFEEYFENIEHSSVWSGLGDCLLIYMKNKKGLNENMKKNVVKINENTLRKIVAESVKKVLKESFEDYYEYIDDNIKKILEHIHGITDTLSQIHEMANVKDAPYLDDIITDLTMNATDFRDDVMEMGVKCGLAKVRETFY